jgi:uncharacterized protein YecE (DUF72 family)
MARLRYGTSSWSTEGWIGPFYPEGTTPREFLGIYSEVFDTVEADVTYYRVPGPSMVDGWRDRTPDGFVLSAKFPRSIVHAGDGPRPNGEVVLVPEQVGEDTERFLTAMDRLGDKAGPLVLQFPYFNKTAFAERGPFLERLDAFLGGLPDRFRYAVELRNKTWIDETLTSLLAAHRTALVLVDMHYMPHPSDLAQSVDVATTDFVYGRLIGDRKAVEAETKTFDRVVVDKSERIGKWADLVTTLREQVDTIYLYANNHYAGHGPETVRQLAREVEART